MTPDNPFSLIGKTVLVTGASSGIGAATAIAAAQAGARVLLNGRDSPRLERTLAAMPRRLEHLVSPADLTAESDLLRLVEDLPPLDGVAHCAGILHKLPFRMIRSAKLGEIMRVNFIAPTELFRSLIAGHKVNKGSSIVIVTSIATSSPSLGNSMYMASKGALQSIARGMALELAREKIRVNCIAPGVVRTPMVESLPRQGDLDDLQSQFPLGRLGEPEDVAYAAIYLLSDASRWVTASTITVDGGYTLGARCLGDA